MKNKYRKINPPINRFTIKKLANIICPYSAKKNKAKDIEEYSTLNPDTSSDSPSVKSNGALFVSATEDIRNITKAGNKGNIYQIC